ncbi:MAG: DUF1549 domain-containing protein [Planctomycetota bacterium]|nr:DUF1549 domain-containing protein [Planctomycetota bacterium]
MIRLRILIGSLLLALCCAATAPAVELHEKIDQRIRQSHPQFLAHQAALSTDTEFLRRIYLDLTGRIPTPRETLQFMQQGDMNKRVQLIDHLVTQPEHARHLQHFFDVMLMERLPKKHVTLEQWQTYLYDSCRDNVSWEQMTWDILSADGAQPATRSAARFLLDREVKPELVTRAIGRVFLGRDLQCAQCHDHPAIDDYPQRHYYGLVSFFSRAYLFNDPKSKQASIGEKAEGTTKFTSVFTNEEATTFPRVLDLPVFTDPMPDKEPYVTKPDKNARGVPKYSRLEHLPGAITHADNQAFRLNIANRLWHFMMGRGFVEPLDMFHADNPASHPELLQLIADDLHDHRYDMRYLLRQLARTEVYQRSSILKTEDESVKLRYTAAHIKPLTAEQLAWSTMLATGLVDITRQATIQAFLASKPGNGKATTTVPMDWASLQLHLETELNKALQSQVTQFTTAFSRTDGPGEFNATANQALFLANSPLISTWLRPRGDNLVARLVAQPDSAKLAAELYLSVLSRLPDATETARITKFVDAFPERTTTIQELVRALLCSAEFRFNH